MIGSIVADIRQLVLELWRCGVREPNRDINAKEQYAGNVYAECPAKLDDNDAYCHHAIDRRFNMD